MKQIINSIENLSYDINILNNLTDNSYDLNINYDFIVKDSNQESQFTSIVSSHFIYINEHTYNILYNYWKPFVLNSYSTLTISDSDYIDAELDKIILYTSHILRMQKYKIYDYKQDIFGNHYTLFKHYLHEKYEDCGEIWVRYKNNPISFPLMKSIEFLDNTDSYSLQIEYENILNMYLTDYDQVKCKHKLYAKILKQMVNSCVQFQIIDDTIIILGYTNYIKSNNQFIRNKNKYLKLVVFKLTEYNNNLHINVPSIRFISPHDYIDYLTDINEYILAYKNYDKICFNLYDIDLNKNNIKDLRSTYQYKNDKFLLDIPLTFTYVTYDINNYVLNTENKTFNNMKFPIIGLCSDSIWMNNHNISDDKNIEIRNQSVWKSSYQENQVTIAYESVNTELLENNNTYPYQELYNSNNMVVDIFIAKCKLIYKTVNNEVFPVIDNINLSIGYDILDTGLTYEELVGTDISNCNAIELNLIHQKYPICNIDSDNNLVIKTIPTRMGGIKSYSDDITNDLTGLTYLRDSIHFIKTDEPVKNTLKELLLKDNITDYTPSFKIGLAELALVLTNNPDLLKKSNLNQKNIITDIDIIEKITNGLKNDISNVTEGFTYNVDLLNTQNSDYLVISQLIKFMPAITYCMIDDMKILINFGNMTSQVKNFISGLESFDVDISIFIDDSTFGGFEHVKKVGWHCGYSSTDYIDWNASDQRYGGPEILTIHSKKYYNYLCKKFNYNLNQPIILQNHVVDIAKSILLKLNVCWYNESMIVGINPNIEVFWNGIYYKKIINSEKLNFNIGCCENSYQEILNLDLINNTLNLGNNTCYTIQTTFDLKYPKATMDYSLLSFATISDIYRHISTNNEEIINQKPGYIETVNKITTKNYVNDALLRRRHWYIYDINQVINGTDKIGLTENDILAYFHNCLTYSIDNIEFKSTFNNKLIDNPAHSEIDIDFNKIYISENYDSTYRTGKAAISSVVDIQNDIVTGAPALRDITKVYLNGYFFDDNIDVTKKYYYGNIFANQPKFDINLNWTALDKTIYCTTLSNTISGLPEANVIIDKSILSTFTYNIVPNIYYNEPISTFISAYIEPITDISVLPATNYNENIQFADMTEFSVSSLVENTLYKITYIPYYTQKQRNVYDLDNQYTYYFAYYPRLLSLSDQLDNTLSGNNLDVNITYFKNIPFQDIFNGNTIKITSAAVNNAQILTSYIDNNKNIYFNSENYPIYNQELKQEINIPIYQTINLTNYKIGNIHLTNIFKEISVDIPSSIYIVAKNNKENVSTTLNFNFKITSTNINNYNNLDSNEISDLSFIPISNYINELPEKIIINDYAK